MNDHAVSELPAAHWPADLPTVDGIDSVRVLHGGSVSASDPHTHEKLVGVNAALAVDFTGSDGPVCVAIVATSTGRSDAGLAPSVPVTECESGVALNRSNAVPAFQLLRLDERAEAADLRLTGGPALPASRDRPGLTLGDGSRACGRRRRVRTRP